MDQQAILHDLAFAALLGPFLVAVFAIEEDDAAFRRLAPTVGLLRITRAMAPSSLPAVSERLIDASLIFACHDADLNAVVPSAVCPSACSGLSFLSQPSPGRPPGKKTARNL